MPRTRAECARAVIQTLRPFFEQTAWTVLSMEHCLRDFSGEQLANAVREMLDGDGLAARRINERLAADDWQRLIEAGLTEDELVGYGFCQHKHAGDSFPSGLSTSGIFAASREEEKPPLSERLLTR